MPADVGKEHPGNATGGTGRKILNLAAADRILMRTGINPNIQPGPVKVLFSSSFADFSLCMSGFAPSFDGGIVVK
jgi:hypothetical protein